MILLDTCTVLWLSLDQSGLSDGAKKLISRHPDELVVSAVSAFEISIKYLKKKLKLPLSVTPWFFHVLEHHQLNQVPITSHIALLASELPEHHTDPFDRLLIATALIFKCPILTPDSHIKKYSEIKVIW